VVLDLGLPRLSGLDVFTSFAQPQQQQPDTKCAVTKCQDPVLILTAMDAIEDRIKGLDAGADDYLSNRSTWASWRHVCVH